MLQTEKICAVEQVVRCVANAHTYTPHAGNNFPLRGCKSNIYEGGIRVPAFIHSTMIPVAARDQDSSAFAQFAKNM